MPFVPSGRSKLRSPQHTRESSLTIRITICRPGSGSVPTSICSSMTVNSSAPSRKPFGILWLATSNGSPIKSACETSRKIRTRLQLEVGPEWAATVGDVERRLFVESTDSTGRAELLRIRALHVDGKAAIRVSDPIQLSKGRFSTSGTDTAKATWPARRA